MRMELKIGRQSVTVKENLIDRVVSYFDPIKGQLHFQARAMAAIAGGYSRIRYTSKIPKKQAAEPPKSTKRTERAEVGDP